MESRTALITGASRGLGRAIAKGLALEGWNLILTARHQKILATVAEDLSKFTQSGHSVSINEAASMLPRSLPGHNPCEAVRSLSFGH